MPRSSEDTRRKILASAYGLFYREGFQRSGVDAVAEAAGVTKRTLYNHFPSKDALIAAVLRDQARLAEAETRRWRPDRMRDGAALVRHLFGALRGWAERPDWRGSGFTRAALELAWAPGHPARSAASAHKTAVEGLLAEALADSGTADAARNARCLSLLIEGALALKLIHGDPGYLDAAEAAALALIATPGAAGLSDPGG